MIPLVPNHRRPDVTFHNSGRIDFSSYIAHQLKLCKGDVIDIAVHNGEYLLYVRHMAGDIIGMYDTRVLPSYNGKKRPSCFRAYSCKLCSIMFSASHHKNIEQPLRLLSGEPVTIEGYGTAIPLITRNPL